MIKEMIHTLRKIFFLQNIYFKSTAIQILVLYMLPLIGLLIAINEVEIATLKKLSPLAAVYFYLLIRTCLRSWIVNRRIGQAPYITPRYKIGTDIKSSVAHYELDGVDQARLLREGEDGGLWKIYDAVFDFHRRTKHGDYLSKQAYYTVYEAQLIRNVPHLIFDSKSAKRSQFKSLYLQSQRLSLEGNFDEHFDTYVPENYQVDSLSFITPEVMQALLEARMYDIELVGDKLLCYGPLMDIQAVEQFQLVCQKLTAHFNDNLNNYKDDRLGGTERSTDVTMFARSLLKSSRKYLPVLLLSGVGVLFVAYFSFTISFEILFNQFSLIVLITFVSTLSAVVKLRRENERLRIAYESERSSSHQI